jgi:hypothetical protein
MTGLDLHEPKGVETASAGTVYVADGSGSGTWVDPLSTVTNLNAFDANGVIEDVSSPNSEYRVRFARACTLTDVYLVMSGPITGTDSVISLYRDGVLLGQTIPVPVAGSGDGVKLIKTLAPSYAFTAGQVLTLKSDGASTDAAKVYFTLKLTV